MAKHFIVRKESKAKYCGLALEIDVATRRKVYPPQTLIIDLTSPNAEAFLDSLELAIAEARKLSAKPKPDFGSRLDFGLN